MKKILSLLTLMLLAVAGLFAQSPAPGILNYQGVARNSVGNVLVNKNITLRLTIRDGSAAGPTVYSETRAVTTNPFGLFNVQLGSAGASAVTGTIAGVPWGVGLKYIQVEIDPNGGSSFINIGTAQLASVPYSLYSTIANDLVLPFNKTQADAGSLFRITNSGTGSGSTALEGITNSGAGNAYAVIGTVNNGSAGGFSAGVRGNNLSTTGLGIGVYGSQSGSGWGVYGVTPNGIGVNGSGGNGTGVWGSATTGTGGRFTSTSGLALHTSGGGVRLQNINEAANRILATIPGDGTATWQDPSAVGIVTGSGTLNFVPKWTPNGTNLGNSQIFDNGTLVGVGAGNAPFAAKLDVLSGQQQIVAHRYTGVTGFDLFYNNTNTYNGYIGTWNTGTSTRNFDVGTGDINNVGSLNLVTQALPRMSILPDGTVGVNTTAPVATSKMHINGAGATGAITTRTSLFTGGNLDGANGHGVIADGEWRAVWGRNTGTGGRIEATGVRGEAGGSNYTNGAGVLGTATGTGNNIGVSGLASGSAAINYGLRGQATGATAGQNWGMFAQTSTAGGQNVAVAGQAPIAANSWAGAFFGRVNITDGTQALNRVFTSDAVGNGSWQPLAAIGGVNGNGTLNFVAKWTPDGSTIGNSLMFDDNSTVSVGGGGFTAPNSLSVLTTSSSGGNGSVGMITATQAGGMFLQQTTGDIHFTANQNDIDNGNVIMTLEDGNLNVGIGTTTPSVNSKLHVQGYGAPYPANAIWANGDLGSTDGHGLVADGEWRGVWGRNNGAGFRVEASGVRGESAGTNYFFGYGVRGDATGASGVDNFGVYGNASGASGRNIGVYGNAAVAANNFAGYFDGKMLINDGTQAAGSILTSVGVTGEATWSTPAGAGLVSGSGTLNFVPKWTPDGTTLGNSMIFDNGNQVQVGSPSGNGSVLNIGVTPGITTASLSYATAGQGFNIHENSSGQLNFEANNTGVGSGTIVMTIDDDELNVGIGTNSPVSNSVLHVDHGTEPGAENTIYTNSDPTTNGNLTGVYGQGGWYGVQGVNQNTQVRGVSVGVRGIGGGSGQGTGYGVIGIANGAASGNNYGLYGEASGATGSNLAAWLNGAVRISDGTQAAGYVLTSDASGNASWQNVMPNVGIGLQFLSANVVIGGSFVNITNWNTITHETGGANYNAGTGEYTITVSGVYQINASLAFSPTAADAIDMILLKNGTAINEITQFVQPTGFIYGMNMNILLHLNAGDVLAVQAGHSAGAGSPVTLIAAFLSNNFTTQLVKRD